MPPARAVLATLTVLLSAAPAYAAGPSGGIALPEPSSLVLFSIGTAGVYLGRRFSSKRPRD